MVLSQGDILAQITRWDFRCNVRLYFFLCSIRFVDFCYVRSLGGSISCVDNFSRIAACWVIVTGMLRLARFQYEEASDKIYFHGLASPGNAMVLITVAAMIWLQPATGFGPDVSTECIFCFEPSNSSVEKPYFDFIILPVMFISGGLMIADRKLPKNKTGIPMKVSGIQMLSIFSATVLSWIHATEYGIDLGDTRPQFALYSLSAILLTYYIITGPKQSEIQEQQLTESE